MISRETEEGFMAAVIELAQLQGWMVHHQRPALTCRGWRSALQGHAGWVDLVLCRPPRLILAECKSARGRLRASQRDWCGVLTQCPGVEYCLWRPKDWEAIRQMLAREG